MGTNVYEIRINYKNIYFPGEKQIFYLNYSKYYKGIFKWKTTLFSSINIIYLISASGSVCKKSGSLLFICNCKEPNFFCNLNNNDEGGCMCVCVCVCAFMLI